MSYIYIYLAKSLRSEASSLLSKDMFMLSSELRC